MKPSGLLGDSEMFAMTPATAPMIFDPDEMQRTYPPSVGGLAEHITAQHTTTAFRAPHEPIAEPL